jgi:hypothetical protein
MSIVKAKEVLVYTILTNGRETSLFTNEVSYESETVEVEGGEPYVLIFVVFVAKNGYHAGQRQRIPLLQVNAICESES